MLSRETLVDMMIGFFLTIILLNSIIFVHEFGHYAIGLLTGSKFHSLNIYMNPLTTEIILVMRDVTIWSVLAGGLAQALFLSIFLVVFQKRIFVLPIIASVIYAGLEVMQSCFDIDTIILMFIVSSIAIWSACILTVTYFLDWRSQMNEST